MHEVPRMRLGRTDGPSLRGVTLIALWLLHLELAGSKSWRYIR